MDVATARALFGLAIQVETHAADLDSAIWTLRLAESVDSIESAVTTLLDCEQPEVALNFVGALSVFWQDQGQVREGLRITEEVVSRVGRATRSRGMARATLVIGELSFRQGDQATASQATSMAKELGNEIGDAWIVGMAELNLARIAFRDGDAERIFHHALQVQALAGDHMRLRTGAIHMLGWAEYTAGNLRGATARFQENVALYRESGNAIGESGELANLADLAVETGDLGLATDFLSQSFAVPGVTSNRYLAPSLIRSTGVLVGMRGAFDVALELLAAAERQYEQFGLVGDPGDELTPQVQSQAMQALGQSRGSAAQARGSTLSFDDAVTLAQNALT